MSLPNSDTIVALATPEGVGAIAIIRLSGSDAIRICNSFFKAKDLTKQASHTIHFGGIYDEKQLVDEVLVSLFKAPSSYTKENVVEISCHGSPFIIQKIIQLAIKHGARVANPGEFTLRAFLNGQLDLAQAEAVADLIASNSKASHLVALQQLRGGISNELKVLRDQLIQFASLLELELDFSEEDVEFADRTQLQNLIYDLKTSITKLIQSFEVGNAMKNGIPVVIVGKPNVGKSTLLNALLKEERAIVSDIPGTTRDTIEDQISLHGVLFRFIDTAGIRETEDKVEAIGVQRTLDKIKQSAIVVYLFDPNETTSSELKTKINEIRPNIGENALLIVANKSDIYKLDIANSYPSDIISISAKNNENLEAFTNELLHTAKLDKLSNNEVVISNIRHLEALQNTVSALNATLALMTDQTSGELLAFEIKRALYHLGLITGEVSTDDLLESIFTRFCIGK